jgi:hypothetical protein
MIVVAASALVLAFLAVRSRQKQAVAAWSQWGPRPRATVSRALGLNVQAKAIENRRRDPFLIVADASVDPKMVVRAPEGVDEAMVFNPAGRRGKCGPTAPRARNLPVAPEPQNPNSAPAPWFGPSGTPPPR